MGDCEVKKTWKEYFENLHNRNKEVQVAVKMCGFGGVIRGNTFGESVGRQKWKLECKSS